MSERFWSKVDKAGSCWLWTAATTDGYGLFGMGKSATVRAHRYSFELAHGRRVEAGMFLDHMCRNRACVNPDHLREVTPLENAQNIGLEGQGANPYRGVHFDKRKGKWRAQYMKNGKSHFLGYFQTSDEARRTVVAARAADLPFDVESRAAELTKAADQ